MKTIQLLFVFGLLIISCNSPNTKKEAESTETLPTKEIDYQVGLIFINDYLEFLYNFDEKSNRVDWINQRKDVSTKFKTELKTLEDAAEKENPEYGLGFDPILDAQDSPSKFEIESKNENYLIVRGVDWPDFRLTIKLVHDRENWLVDGAGVINVPKDQRIER